MNIIPWYLLVNINKNVSLLKMDKKKFYSKNYQQMKRIAFWKFKVAHSGGRVSKHKKIRYYFNLYRIFLA